MSDPTIRATGEILARGFPHRLNAVRQVDPVARPAANILARRVPLRPDTILPPRPANRHRRPVARAAGRVLTLLLILLSAGCDRASDGAGGADAVPLSSLPVEEAWDELESRLLMSQPQQIQFIVGSEGAVQSSLRGALALLGAEGLTLTADGDFAGVPQSLRLAADAQRIRVGEGPDSTVVPTAAELHESVVIGLTRMGILHNLARLTAGMTPDHMEGGVREWVTVDSLSWGPEETVEGRPALSFDFAIRVSGQPAGNARLYIDAETERPLRRTQTVRFPEGEMNVTESYEFF